MAGDGFRGSFIAGSGELRIPAVRSVNYVPGVAGWQLRADGVAELSGAQVRGAVVIGSRLLSDNYVPGVSGWAVEPDGYAEFLDVFLRGTGDLGGAFAGQHDGSFSGTGGLASPGFEDGAAGGWRVGADGFVEFVGGIGVDSNGLSIGGGAVGARSLAANESLRYRGTELSTLIARRADGIVAKTYKNTDSRHVTNGIIEVSELEFTAQVGKTYGIHTSSLRVGSVAGSSAPFVRLAHTIDGTEPTVASPLLTIDNGSPVPAGSTILQRTYQAGTVRRVRMWLCVSVGSGEAWLRGSDDYPIEIYVTDLADSVSDTGIDFGTGTTTVVAAPKAEYSDVAYCTWSRAYDSDNTYSGRSQLYQGRSPYAASRGNQRSLAGFDAPTIRGWLAGADNITARLVFYADHWHSFGGGVAVVGTHDYPGGPATWADARVRQDRARVVSDTRDDLVTLDVSSWVPGLLAGEWDGIAFGPGPDTTTEYYGYMRGAGEAPAPRLELSWRK